MIASLFSLIYVLGPNSPNKVLSRTTAFKRKRRESSHAVRRVDPTNDLHSEAHTPPGTGPSGVVLYSRAIQRNSESDESLSKQPRQMMMRCVRSCIRRGCQHRRDTRQLHRSRGPHGQARRRLQKCHPQKKPPSSHAQVRPSDRQTCTRCAHQESIPITRARKARLDAASG